MSWHFFFFVFNSLQTFALNSTSTSAGAGIPVVLILFSFFFFWPIIVRVRFQVFISISNWLDTETSQTISLCDRSDASRFRQKTPPHALTSVPSQGLDFATNSAVFLTTPNGTWPPPSTWLLQCLRYQHWQLLCAALVLLSSLLHSKATTFFLPPYSVKAAYEAFIKMLVTIFYCRAGEAKLCRDPSGGTAWPSITRTTDYILCVAPCMCLLKVYRCVHAFQLGSKVYFPPKLDRCVLRTNTAKLHQ